MRNAQLAPPLRTKNMEGAVDIPARVNGSNDSLPKPHIKPDEYAAMHKRSLEQSDEFWRETANKMLAWDVPFKTVQHGSFDEGNIAYFLEGHLNASYNAVDRWAIRDPNQIAIIWEADEPGEDTKITYGELLRRVCQVAGTLRSLGVKKGDLVIIYLPMIPEAAIAMLACARIGAVHSVVFAGFSADSLRDRVQDSSARVVITSDEGKRGGRTIAAKSIVDAALKECPGVEHVLVVKRTGAEDVPWVSGRDMWLEEKMKEQRAYIPPVLMSSEDPLFVLYTSGSTGRPKGIVHTTAGYILCAALTVKDVFDVHAGDKFGCMADIGWITGHTYIVYGPLVLGTTTLIFESTPMYPNPSRYWDVVDKHGLTQFYTAPTSIRLLRRMGTEHVASYKLDTLRVLGTVGEPINPEAWQWYNDNVGRGQCAIVDTYWMTEGGAHMITSLPGAIRAKPGSATVPFWGIEPVILDPHTGKELHDADAEGALVIRKPWPSVARTIMHDQARFMDTYMRAYPGYFFTGDSAARDKDGYIWIKGRVDDVINVSGHRLSTAEIESALGGHPGVAEAAVVGAPDEVTGQSITAFLALKPDYVYESGEALVKELTIQVRRAIGPFATPKRIICVEDLPKTRSGKIVRRVLRKIVCNEADQLGDLSSVSDPSIVDHLKVCNAWMTDI
ncbi:acetate--CoA ligase [Malassezia vespertilionis]|uniref:acetate--CoA ligase n=1 Tax=Malassezia vespertilionis TaxID=2020962 RepID=UPI0024B1564B|nr:acetate--CoA ligase [Malassezia vespertilionis]WFD05978.1 acetate--CoA ligase [Malassezia vespertilionis]